jgi:hypothetical protein
VKTRATRVSDRVFFKHQYITNPQITPETLVIKAAADLTNVLKGTVSRDVEMVKALQKVSSLFTKNSSSKNSNNEVTRTTNSPHVTPTCTTFKGGQQTAHTGSSHSKGANRSPGG